MTLLPSSGRSRAALVATVTGALVVGATGSTPALGVSPHDSRAEIISSFAKQTRERSTTASPLAAQKDAPAVTGKAKAPQTQSLAGGKVSDAPQPAAASAECDGLGVLLTQTQDHNHISWEAQPGATSFDVRRERAGGASTTIAPDLPGTSTSFEDTGQNTLGLVAYTVVVSSGSSSFSCRYPEVDETAGADWMTMSTYDGAGYPDLFFAGDTEVWEQDTYGPGFPSYTAEASRPAFSPNGRLVAAVEQVAGVFSITVRKASTGALLWSVASPGGTMLDEPAFSPDGQRIVAEALTLPALDVSRGLYTFPVNTTTHPLIMVPPSAGLVTADWIDTPGSVTSTTIVAANLAPGGLLTLVNASTGARSPVAGTAGALDPMGQPDGSVLFATLNGASSTLARRAANGKLSTLATLSDALIRWPVAASDGNIYFYDQYPDPYGGPDAYYWSIDRYDGSSTTVTDIGGPRDFRDVGFYGFDMRSPLSPGTSNFGGNANGDILARSSTGVLYAYPLSGGVSRFFDARRQIGGGWNVMKQFVAAGDLNTDRRGDVMAIDTTGSLWFYPGRGNFTLGTRTRIGGGWGAYAIVSGGDFNGDTRADLIARDSGGTLWLYLGNGRGGLGTRQSIGGGWNVMNAFAGVGDWNYDNTADLLARDRATGVLWLYPGNGAGTFSTRRSLGGGWQARTAFATTENWGGYTEMFARTTTGVLLDYPSVGNGVIYTSMDAGSGWNPYTITG